LQTITIVVYEDTALANNFTQAMTKTLCSASDDDSSGSSDDDSHGARPSFKEKAMDKWKRGVQMLAAFLPKKRASSDTEGLCMCVCMCERKRERERGGVFVCMCVCVILN
jgi:hypothetical protein